ncbi:KH domain-containing protein [Patescibacteria group bacterium]|nr:KH domain-containing protein [Patescibacteria group bacterium]
MEKNIKALVQELFKQLEIKPETIELVKSETGNGYQLNLKFSDQDTGILIGYHGDTISALQLIINLLIYKKQGEWLKLEVNIGDYRQKRAESLEKMALDSAQRVKFSGQPMALFNLNPFERRLIHEFLAKDPAVTTESEGEAKNRHLIIKPATAPHEALREVGPKQA